MKTSQIIPALDLIDGKVVRLHQGDYAKQTTYSDNPIGVQAIVVGIDSWFEADTGKYWLNQYTGDESRTRQTNWQLLDWVTEVQKRGAGEIVLNMMNQDGVRQGYDLTQLKAVREVCQVPLIASGGAGEMVHFRDAFTLANVDGALAASVFHKRMIEIGELKAYLAKAGIAVRS